MAIAKNDQSKLEVKFADIEAVLLSYKNKDAVERQKMLDECKAILQEAKKKKPKNAQEAIQRYDAMARAATIIQYANHLHHMENQQPFDFLVDFVGMTKNANLWKELEPYMELKRTSQATATMRLKVPLDQIPADAWKKFQELQIYHFKNEHKGFFHPDANAYLDPGKETKIFPIPAQGLGDPKNRAVDKTATDPVKGRVAFAYNKDIKLYFMAGGGMRENESSSAHKLLEEHIEELRPNLYKDPVGIHYFNQIDSAKFLSELTKIFEAEKKNIKSEDLKTKIAAVLKVPGKDNSVYLANIIELIKAAKDPKTPDDNTYLNALKAKLQVAVFELTPLRDEALKVIHDSSKRFEIRQYLDTRTLGGCTQTTELFVFDKNSLDKLFTDKGFQDDEHGDDLEGTEKQNLTYLQQIQQFDHIRFSHVLNGAVGVTVGLETGALAFDVAYNSKDYDKACDALIIGADEAILRSQKAEIMAQCWKNYPHLNTDYPFVFQLLQKSIEDKKVDLFLFDNLDAIKLLKKPEKETELRAQEITERYNAIMPTLYHPYHSDSGRQFILLLERAAVSDNLSSTKNSKITDSFNKLSTKQLKSAYPSTNLTTELLVVMALNYIATYPQLQSGNAQLALVQAALVFEDVNQVAKKLYLQNAGIPDDTPYISELFKVSTFDNLGFESFKSLIDLLKNKEIRDCFNTPIENQTAMMRFLSDNATVLSAYNPKMIPPLLKYINNDANSGIELITIAHDSSTNMQIFYAFMEDNADKLNQKPDLIGVLVDAVSRNVSESTMRLVCDNLAVLMSRKVEEIESNAEIKKLMVSLASKPEKELAALNKHLKAAQEYKNASKHVNFDELVNKLAEVENTDTMADADKQALLLSLTKQAHAKEFAGSKDIIDSYCQDPNVDFKTFIQVIDALKLINKYTEENPSLNLMELWQRTEIAIHNNVGKPGFDVAKEVLKQAKIQYFDNHINPKFAKQGLTFTLAKFETWVRNDKIDLASFKQLESFFTTVGKHVEAVTTASDQRIKNKLDTLYSLLESQIKNIDATPIMNQHLKRWFDIYTSHAVSEEKLKLMCTTFSILVSKYPAEFASHEEMVKNFMNSLPTKSDSELEILNNFLAAGYSSVMDDGVAAYIDKAPKEDQNKMLACAKEFYAQLKAPTGVVFDVQDADAQRRVILMKLLDQGAFIGTIDPKANDKNLQHCYMKYTEAVNQILLNRTGTAVKSAFKGLSRVRELSTEQYDKLTQLSKELKEVRHNGSLGQLKDAKTLKTDLKKQLKAYSSKLFISKDRKTQLKQIKGKISGVVGAQAPNYMEIIQDLHKQQIACMVQDTKTNKHRSHSRVNKSGRSRLYTTLNKMQELVVNDMMTKLNPNEIQVYQAFCRDEFKNIAIELKKLCKQEDEHLVKKNKLPHYGNIIGAIETMEGNLTARSVLDVMAAITDSKLPGHLKAIANELDIRFEPLHKDLEETPDLTRSAGM